MPVKISSVTDFALYSPSTVVRYAKMDVLNDACVYYGVDPSLNKNEKATQVCHEALRAKCVAASAAAHATAGAQPAAGERSAKAAPTVLPRNHYTSAGRADVSVGGEIFSRTVYHPHMEKGRWVGHVVIQGSHVRVALRGGAWGA